MFSVVDVVVVALISCPKSLEYTKPICHMIAVDSRLDINSKSNFMNDRCDSVGIIFSLTFLIVNF